MQPLREAIHLRIGRTRLPPGTTLLCVAVVAVFMAVLLTWYGRVPGSHHFTGMFQGDMPTYLCYARTSLRSSFPLSYANPFDLREIPPPIFVNLHLTVTGWLLGLGLSAALIENLLRAVLGVLMLRSLARLSFRIFGNTPWYWAALVVTGCGGGIAWLMALEWPFEIDRWAQATADQQSTYYWWFLDVFRNLIYPYELLYHWFFFSMLDALVARRWREATAWYAIASICNPFIGVHMAGVILGMALVAPRGEGLRWRILPFVVAAVFAVYYRFLLRLDPIGASIAEQHHGAYPAPLTMHAFLVGHGLGLIGLVALLADPRFRRAFLKTSYALPLLGLLAWSLLLMSHTRFLDPSHSMQPLHFSRGYSLVAAWFVTLSWMRFRLPRLLGARGVRGLALALALLSLPDNLLFLRDQYLVRPNEPLLVWRREVQEMYEFVRSLPPGRHVLNDDWFTSVQLCASSEHRYAFGTPLTTPFYQERIAQIARYRRDPSVAPELVQWADVILVAREDSALRRAVEGSGAWEQLFANRAWTVFGRTPAAPPEAGEPR